MKKIYNQSTIEIVHLENNDIVTISRSTTDYDGEEILAPDRGVFDPYSRSWDAGY